MENQESEQVTLNRELEDECARLRQELGRRNEHISWRLYWELRQLWLDMSEDLFNWKWVIILIVIECVRCWIDWQHLNATRDMNHQVFEIQVLFENFMDYFAPNAPRG
jgi:hypothetical protein